MNFDLRSCTVSSFLLALLVGCGTAVDSNPEETAGGEAPSGAEAPAEVPAEAPPDPAGEPPPAESAASVDTVMIEGSAEELPTRRVAPPPGFPLGFTTVVPADMAVTFGSSGEGDSMRLEAQFGGVPSPQARVTFVVLPEGTDAAEAESIAGELAASAGGAPTGVERFPWAAAAYRLSGDRFGFIALGERAGRWYYFDVQYPPEFGDGMGPRVDLVLRRWRWADDRPLL